MAIINKSKKYKWEFANIGGASRVKISTGEDIAHLDELDPKMWTVLSCPVKGLEICEKSLAYMDTDADGKIRVNDVIATSKWLSAVVKDLNVLTAGQDFISLDAIDQENADGKKIYAAAKQILENKEQAQKIYEKLYELKVVEYVKSKIKVTNKSVTSEEFAKLAQEM